MITAPQAYIDLLKDSDTLVFADCYLITLQDGTTLRWSSADVPVTVPINGVQTTFALGPLIERSNISIKIGTSVDKLDLTLWPRDTDMLGPVTLLQAAVAGRLDGATLTLYRAAAASWTSGWAGAIVRYSGTLAEVTATRQSVQIAVQSHLQLLNTQQPVRKFQPGCTWTLYDADCSAARRKSSGTVTSVMQRWQFSTTIDAAASAGGGVQLSRVLTGGQLKFTSGSNAGFTYPVRSWSGTQATLLRPAGLALAVGDAFEVTWGCDKTIAVCDGVFGNKARFGGFPHIPAAETAVPV